MYHISIIDINIILLTCCIFMLKNCNKNAILFIYLVND